MRADADAPIGVFDSGVGGLSVLAALRQRLPGRALHYVADIAHAPYGERADAYVMARSERIARHLVDAGAGLIVVACNTATAQAIARVRECHAGLPVVGVEPGVKPAVAASRSGRVGVLATPGTLGSPRYAALVARHAAAGQVLSMPCPGLAAAIEQGDAGASQVEHLLDDHGVAKWRPHYWRDRVGGNRVQLSEQRFEAVGGVLSVDQHPIAAAASDDLGGDRAASTRPEPDEGAILA